MMAVNTLHHGLPRPRSARDPATFALIANFCDASPMTYPGGKGRAYQSLISLMPPHEVYIETHLGGGAILSHKRPARRSIGIDIDARAIGRWDAGDRPDVELVLGDAVTFLRSFPFAGGELVFCDPPYWPDTRRRTRCYRHDYEESDHVRLLETLTALPCRVMLTGYWNATYDRMLNDWIATSYQNWIQTGPVVETVWMNFQPGSQLHDYSFVGMDFRERERLRRRRRTHVSRLERAPPLERGAILAELADAFPEEMRAAVDGRRR